AMEMNKKTQFNIWYWVAAFFGLMVFQYLFTTATQVAEIPYTQFQAYLQEGRIAQVAVSDRFIQGTFTEPVDGRPRFITTRVEPDLARDLAGHGVVVTGQIESTFLRDLLSWVIPVALFIGIWLFILRRMGGGLGGGLSRPSRRGVDRTHPVTDAGADAWRSPLPQGRGSKPVPPWRKHAGARS